MQAIWKVHDSSFLHSCFAWSYSDITKQLQIAVGQEALHDSSMLQLRPVTYNASRKSASLHSTHGTRVRWNATLTA